jgi:hypothetical protein
MGLTQQIFIKLEISVDQGIYLAYHCMAGFSWPGD